MKIIVTGSSGFVGTNTCLRLLEEGHEVVGIYHNKQPQISHPNFSTKCADLTNRDECREAFNVGADAIIMTAAYVGGAEHLLQHPMRFVTDTTVINLYVLEAAYANGISKVVYISSGMVYPERRDALTEDMAFIDDPYEKYFFGGWSRRYSEVVCRMYAEKIPNPVDVTVLRIDNLYGPYDSFRWKKSHVMAALIRKAVERMDPFEVWGDGKDYKDFIYIEDLVQGIILALNNMKGFKVFNIASGENHTINEALEMILEAADYKDAKIVYNASKPTMIPYKRMSIDKARNELGFEPKYTLGEGIEKTVKWYRETGCKLTQD